MTMAISAAGHQRSWAGSACRGALCVLRGCDWLLQRVKMMEKLWGDNFFDPSTKKWTKKHTGTASCKRGFVQFVYEPIKTIIDACMNDNKAKLWAMTDKLGITGKLKAEDKEMVGKPLMKRIMQSWLPAHEVRRHPCRPWQPGRPPHCQVSLSALVPCSVLIAHASGALPPLVALAPAGSRLLLCIHLLSDSRSSQERPSPVEVLSISMRNLHIVVLGCRLHGETDWHGCRLCWR